MMGSEGLTPTKIEDLGYILPRKLPTGEWAALQKMLYTTGLCILENEISYRTRWCYENMEEAAVALLEWDGVGDPPGPWVKNKPSERLGPGATEKFAWELAAQSKSTS